MSVNARSLTLFMICLLVLAGCGGGNNDDQAPEVTAEPTLTFDERASYAPGSAENPLRSMIHPVTSVLTELQLILADLSNTPAENITAQTVLRDELGLPGNLNTLSAPISERFGVSLPSSEVGNIQTVDQLAMQVEVELGKQVAQTLFDRTSIYFDVIPVTSYGDGLNALCESNQGVVSIAWLDGITTVSAIQGGCGDASLRLATLGGVYNVGLIEDIELMPEIEATPDEEGVEPTEASTETPTPEPSPEPTEETDIEVTPEATADVEENPLDESLRFGTPVFAIYNRDLGSASFDLIRGRTFCRVGQDDFYTWLVPSLMMRRNNIDPQSDIASINDYENEAQLVRAVADGRCTAAVLSEDIYETLLDLLPEEVWDDVRLGEMTPAFPYATLVYPADIQQGVRLTLNEVFSDLATDDTSGAALRWLLGQDVFVEAGDNDLSAFTAFLQSTGLNFGQLGN